MKYGKILLALLVVVGLSGFSWRMRGADAKAELKDSKGNHVGEAILKQKGADVKIAVRAEGLSEGQHGIHIHSVGKCEGPDFASAGPHFNPSNKQHGLQNPQGHHGGDLPNLQVSKKGKVRTVLTARGVDLKSGGAQSLLKPEGTALVIHAGPDDEKSDPAGNSGGRIICGVIEKV